MKIYTIIALFLMSTMAHALITNPYSNSFDNTGTIKHKDQVWIKIRNKTGASLARGTLMMVESGTYDDGATATKTSDHLQVPTCMVDETIAINAMGKCQVYGYTDALLFDAETTAAANEPIYVDDDNAGYARAIASASVGAYHVKLGTFLDASAASGAIEAFLNMM